MPAELAVETLAALSARGRHRLPDCHAAAPRTVSPRRCSTGSASTYPLIATEEPKGPIVKRLHVRGRTSLSCSSTISCATCIPCATHAPDCLLINLMANADFRHGAASGNGVACCDWTDVAAIIRRHFALARSHHASRTSAVAHTAAPSQPTAVCIEDCHVIPSA